MSPWNGSGHFWAVPQTPCPWSRTFSSLVLWCFRPFWLLGPEELQPQLWVSCSSVLREFLFQWGVDAETKDKWLRRVQSALSGEGVGRRAQEWAAVAKSGKMDTLCGGRRWREEGSLDTCTTGSVAGRWKMALNVWHLVEFDVTGHKLEPLV